MTLRRQRLDRARVLAAAAEHADTHGLDETTLSALARELGIKTPSLYRHVASHAALVEGIATIALADLHAVISNAAAGRSGPEAVHAVADAYRAYAHAHPGRYAATTAFAVSAGHDAYRDAGSAIIEVLRATLRQWHLEQEDRIDAIRGLRAALHGYVTLEQTGGFGLSQDVDHSFRVLVDSLIAGLDHIAAAPDKPAKT